MHSLRWTGLELNWVAWFGFFMWLFEDRLTGCLTMLVIDLGLFIGMVVYMILSHRNRERCAVRIDGHSFYKRKRCVNKPHRVGNYLMIYILLSQNLISGVGSEMLRERIDTGNYEGSTGDHDWHDQYDSTSLMARSRPRQGAQGAQMMPSPHARGFARDFEDSDARSEEDMPDGGFHQMAFLFLQDGMVVTGRIDWSSYWTMHSNIASLLGCHINRLVAIFHVTSPPTDLEEMDTQVMLPLRTEEVQHSAAVVYVLVDIEYHEEGRIDMVPTRRFATHFPIEAARVQVLRRLEIEDYCRSLEDRCIIWINHEIWPVQSIRSRTFRSGDYVQCALPTPESARCETSRQEAEALMRNLRAPDDAENEVTNLMQRNVIESQGSSNHGQIHTLSVHAIGTDYIELPIEDNGQSIVEQLALEWAFSRDEIINMHEVLEPPIDEQRSGEATYLLEMRGDAVQRLWPEDKFVLTEFIIRNPRSTESKRRKVVLWSRELLNRHQTLVLMRVDEFCRRKETRECVLSHNNRIWGRDDTTSHRVQDGDYLLVEAFVSDISLDEAKICLERLEKHECNRRLYTTAECEMLGEVTGDHNTQTSREGSRSRSRSRDDQRDCSPSGGGHVALRRRHLRTPEATRKQ